jgi:hypothetical protein
MCECVLTTCICNLKEKHVLSCLFVPLLKDVTLNDYNSMRKVIKSVRGYELILCRYGHSNLARLAAGYHKYKMPIVPVLTSRTVDCEHSPNSLNRRYITLLPVVSQIIGNTSFKNGRPK